MRSSGARIPSRSRASSTADSIASVPVPLTMTCAPGERSGWTASSAGPSAAPSPSPNRTSREPLDRRLAQDLGRGPLEEADRVVEQAEPGEAVPDLVQVGGEPSDRGGEPIASSSPAAVARNRSTTQTFRFSMS